MGFDLIDDSTELIEITIEVTPLITVIGTNVTPTAGEVGIGGDVLGKLLNAIVPLGGVGDGDGKKIGTEKTTKWPFVPDVDVVLNEIANIGFTTNHPKQFVNDAFEIELFGGDDGKPLGKVVNLVIAPNEAGTNSSALIGLVFAQSQNVA